MLRKGTGAWKAIFHRCVCFVYRFMSWIMGCFFKIIDLTSELTLCASADIWKILSIKRGALWPVIAQRKELMNIEWACPSSTMATSRPCTDRLRGSAGSNTNRKLFMGSSHQGCSAALSQKMNSQQNDSEKQIPLMDPALEKKMLSSTWV